MSILGMPSSHAPPQLSVGPVQLNDLEIARPTIMKFNGAVFGVGVFHAEEFISDRCVGVVADKFTEADALDPRRILSLTGA